MKTLVDAAPAYINEKNLNLFNKHNVYNELELKSRYDIKLEKYWKTLNIEALTMIDMVRKGYVGAVIGFMDELSDVCAKKEKIGMYSEKSMEAVLLKNVSKNADLMMERLEKLEKSLSEAGNMEESMELARKYRDSVIPAMDKLREVVDELETLIPGDKWPYPSYGDLLYSVV